MIVLSVAFLSMLLACKYKPKSYTSFDQYPVYEGNDLELVYTSSQSSFKIWSPAAEAAELRLYTLASDTAPSEIVALQPSEQGTWIAELQGDKKGLFYTFRTKHNGVWLAETPGIWAKAVSVNGNKACILDFQETNPNGWENDKSPDQQSFADIILYELHIRDMSISPKSGITHKGKYLGLAEENTKNAYGMSTGLDHLKEMGITHVHLLPCFDFKSIDETQPDSKYNWGYDPQNYNVPEGTFSTNPSDPATRIKEFKEMVMALHRNGIRVIMDVVYNHTGGANELSNFNLIAPGYYYRHNNDSTYSNASGCGNETASERPMMQQYIVESVKYWATEYHIDGFRFDLMGIHDTETMNKVRTALDAISPQIFVYGEGWLAGGSPLAEEKRAIKSNVPKMPRIAAFSDEIRDAVKGPWNDNKATAFASGKPGLEESIKYGVVGGIQHPDIDYAKVNYTQQPWATEPTQCITYVSCHDNHALWDKFKLTCPKATQDELIRMNKLANAIVLTTQGVPFLHNGVEMLRSKKGVENSFESPDSINMINWDWKYLYKDVVEFHKDLIKLRKLHPVLHMGNADNVRNNLRFLNVSEANFVAFSLNGAAVNDSWKEVIILYNGNNKPIAYEVPNKPWKVYLDETKVWFDGKPLITKGRVVVPPISAVILGVTE